MSKRKPKTLDSWLSKRSLVAPTTSLGANDTDDGCAPTSGFTVNSSIENQAAGDETQVTHNSASETSSHQVNNEVPDATQDTQAITEHCDRGLTSSSVPIGDTAADVPSPGENFGSPKSACSAGSFSLSSILQQQKPNDLPPQITNGRKLNFQQSWYSAFPWLHGDQITGKVLCFSCLKATRLGLHPANSSTEETFVRTGFNNWKKAIEKFKTHEGSSYHKNSVYLLACQLQLPVNVQATSSGLKSQEKAQSYLRTIFTSLIYLGKQGLAVRGDDKDDGNFINLLKLRSDDIDGFSTWLQQSRPFTSWAIQNEILEIVAHALLRHVMSILKEAKIYSIIVDETSDLSVQEQVSINVRVVDQNLISREYFLGLYETSSTTGVTLLKIIMDALQRFNLPLEDLRGQCYDGAANMSGKFKGVKSRILEKQPKALFVHCYNHSLNLALQESARSISYIRDVLSTVHEIGTIIRASPKRMAQFNTLCSNEEKVHLKPRPLCPTRWSVRANSIESVLSSYGNIFVLLEELSTSNDKAASKSKGLVMQLEKGEFYLGLLMTKIVFAVSERLASVLQTESASLCGSTEAAAATVLQLTGMKNDDKFEQLWSKMQDACDDLGLEEPSLPRQRQPPRRLKTHDVQRQFQSAKERLRSLYYEFIENVCDGINDRFNQENISFYLKCEKALLNYTEDSVSSSDHIKEVCEFYEWNPESLGSQLDGLKRLEGIKWGTVKEITDFFRELSPEVKNLYPLVSSYLKHLLVVPCSSAGAERSFSMLRRIKSYLRTSMGQARLNHCCVINSYSDFVDLINVDDLMKEFVSRSNRTTKFGKLV